MRILIVDDTDETRLLLRAMLQSLGHEVCEADNGRSAIDIALKEKPDLILMDIRMPFIDGLLSARALRAIEGFQHLPIIAITAIYSGQTREDAIAAGCNDCIAKPIMPDQLAEIVERYAATARSDSAGTTAAG